MIVSTKVTQAGAVTRLRHTAGRLVRVHHAVQIPPPNARPSAPRTAG